MEYWCICLTSASLTRSRHILQILERIQCCWCRSLSPPWNSRSCRLMFLVRTNVFSQDSKMEGEEKKQLGEHLGILRLLLPLVYKMAQKQTFMSWVNIFLSCKACFLMFVRITGPLLLVNVRSWRSKRLILVLQLMAVCVVYPEVGIWIDSPRCSVSAFPMVLLDSIVMLLKHCAWDSFQHL